MRELTVGKEKKIFRQILNSLRKENDLETYR